MVDYNSDDVKVFVSKSVEYAHSSDAAFDLRSNIDMVLKAR